MARVFLALFLLFAFALHHVSAQTASPTNSPPAPINVINACPNHIIHICPSWSNPTGFSYPQYEVSFIQSGCATCTATTFLTSQRSGRVSNLLPATSYDFTIVGILGNGVRSLPSTAVTFTTDPSDPKLDPTKDINNIVCNSVYDTTEERFEINCTWNAAAEALTRLVIKWRCTSPIRKNASNKKRLYGAKAQATAVTLHVHRDVATCAVFFRAYYARRPANRHALTVIMGL